MSNETMVTLQGWLGSDPMVRKVGEAETPVASFRMGCTPRRFHRGRGEWVDGPTQWYTVNTWRGLALHCERSLKKGDPVLVYGRLTHRTYVNRSEVEVVALEVEAVTLGHDLTRGATTFLKAPPPREEVVVPEAPSMGTPAPGSVDPSADRDFDRDAAEDAA